MTTQAILENLSIVSSSLGLLVASFSVWNVAKSIVKRLAIIQNRLDSLKGLLIVFQGRVNDVEKFLSAKQGYNIRGSIHDIEETFLNQYNDQDTGF
ncbi:hypothetical protein [Microcoleus sp. herbarium14]|uniref:hypothetical protein n=1 Tax=Microcoleus sp. herbarium14 TaxID=3055439 RepID=UPI002FD7726F